MDTETEIDDSFHQIIDTIYDLETEFIDEDKQDDTYYIGVYHVTPDAILLGACISPQTYFQFSNQLISSYLSNFCVFHSKPLMKKIEILKTKFQHVRVVIHGREYIYTSYDIIVKTFWLKIFQRKCREYCRWKKSRDLHKARMQTQRYFEIWGKYPANLHHSTF